MTFVRGCAVPAWIAAAVIAAGSAAGAPGSARGSTVAAKPPAVTHDATFAPHLPPAARFTGKSIRNTRLSEAAYSLTKLIGLPKTVDVACWSTADWAGIEGDDDDIYSTLGFWWERLPHWVHLSPHVCRAIETLINHRPLYPNIYTAEAVETLTHEMMHAIGVESEARAECFGMQLSAYLARDLGVPAHYAARLAQLNLQNYADEPPNYIDRAHCREDGAWDLLENENSPPWHLS